MPHFGFRARPARSRHGCRGRRPLNRSGRHSPGRGLTSAALPYATTEPSKPTIPTTLPSSWARMKGLRPRLCRQDRRFDDFERRFASSPLIPDALLERTQALMGTGCNDDAIAVYRRLIADYPATSQGRRAYLEMAMTLLDSGRTDEATAAYRTVISLFPHLRGRPACRRPSLKPL